MLEKKGHHRRIIHAHVPKTAGTALNTVFYNTFGRDRIFEAYSPSRIAGDYTEKELEMLHDAQTIIGHVPYGYPAYPGVEYTYVSVFRDPVERVLSAMNFKLIQLVTGADPRSTPDQREGFLKNHFRFLHFLFENKAFSSLYSNMMVKYAAGVEGLKPLPNGATDVLARAIENCKNDDYRFGFQETFEEFRQQLCDDFGLVNDIDTSPEGGTPRKMMDPFAEKQSEFNLARNKYTRVLTRESVGEQGIALIRLHNKLDCEFYDQLRGLQ